MSYDYANWPTLATGVADALAAAGVTLRSAATTSRRQAVLDAVIREVRQWTRREFVAATATRTFDGSGTPTLEVDEYVSLTSVALLGEAGSVALTFNNVTSQADNLRPSTLIHLFRSTIPWGQQPLLYTFPQGRENIQVVASWGYAATVPEDLWLAVASEAAARLAAEAVYNPGYNATTGTHRGRLARLSAAGVTQEWTIDKAADACGWSAAYRQALKAYRRPLSVRLRRLRAPMV